MFEFKQFWNIKYIAVYLEEKQYQNHSQQNMTNLNVLIYRQLTLSLTSSRKNELNDKGNKTWESIDVFITFYKVNIPWNSSLMTFMSYLRIVMTLLKYIFIMTLIYFDRHLQLVTELFFCKMYHVWIIKQFVHVTIVFRL